MTAYRVTWPTEHGKLDVDVEADVTTDVRSERVGAVAVDRVFLTNDRGERMKVELEDFMTAERFALYEALRISAGLCSRCFGQRKLEVFGRKNGKNYKKRVPCSACGGTGKVRA